jgi:hypothetical protein
VAVVVLLSQGAPAGGAFIPWKYNWTRNPTKIFSDTSNTSYVELTDEPLRTAAGSSDVVATNLDVISDAPPGFPDLFTDKGYTLTLFLLDVHSGNSGTMDFTGLINGSVSMFSSNLENTFTGQTQQSMVLGNNLYEVTIGPFTPPGPPGSSNSGAIGAHASVRVTQIHKTPEPSTLALALCGAPLMGYRVWRRRRARTQE